MTNFRSLLMMGAFLLVAVNALPKGASKKGSKERPAYIGCVDSTECKAGNCCVIGNGRFSIPTCQSVEEMHGPCRPYGHQSFNTTVSYPDGVSLELTNVYRQFCSCAANLACDLDSSTCLDPIRDPNYLYNSIIV